MKPSQGMDRKEFLKTLFAYGASLAVAPSLLHSDEVCRYPRFGFEFRKPAGWVHLSIPRYQYLTEQQRVQIADQDWFDWIRQVSGLPVVLLSKNDAPWNEPTPMVAFYANEIPQGMTFEECMTDAPEAFGRLFPGGKLLEDIRYRHYGPTRGSEFAIEYKISEQHVRSRGVMAWGSRFEICLSLEDYPANGADAGSEFKGVLNSLVIS